MRFLHRHSLVIVLVALLYVGSCAFEGPSQPSKIQIELRRAARSQDVSQMNPNSSITLPTDASGFDCYAINVMAPDINSRPQEVAEIYPSNLIDQVLAGSSCSYPGVSDGFVPLPGSGILNFNLAIPSGPTRVIQFLGLKFTEQQDIDDPECPGPTIGLALQRLINEGREPEVVAAGLYELGRVTTDIFPTATGGSLPISLEVDYDPQNAKLANCLAEPLSPPPVDTTDPDPTPLPPITPPIDPPSTVTVATGSYSLQSSFSGLASFDPIDLDFGNFFNTGHLDLSVSYSNGSDAYVDFFPGLATGSFDESGRVTINISNPSKPYLQTIKADVSDSLDEILVGGGPNNSLAHMITWTDGPGVPFYWSIDDQNGLQMGRDIHVADINNDGFDDIVGTQQFSTAGVRALIGFGDKTFSTTFGDYGGFSFVMNAADINADGEPDITVHSDFSGGSLIAYISDGDGTYQMGQTWIHGFSYSPTAVKEMENGFFNNDTHMDFVIAEESLGSLYIVLGNGDGTFSFGGSFSTGASPEAIEVDDHNDDGFDDITVIVNSSAFGIQSYFNDGDGTFTQVACIDTTPSVFLKGLKSIDLNDDGFKDAIILAAPGPATGQINFWIQETDEVTSP